MRTYTLAEQTRLIRSTGQTPMFRIAALMNRRMAEVIDLGLQRVKEGHAIYGDQLFHKTLEQIDADVMEELADAAVYEAVYQLKKTGVIQ